MTTPQHAWHYTTAAGLISIVTTHRLWATSAAFMNDRDEIRTGRQALQAALEARRHTLEQWQLEQLERMGISEEGKPHKIFLLSAALEGDLLTLWRSYGGGVEAEYAIDLDPSIRLLPVRQSEADRHPEPAPPGWYEDAYDLGDDGQQILTYDPDGVHTAGLIWAPVQYLDDASAAADAELDELLDGLREPSADDRWSQFALMLSDYLIGPDPTVLFKSPGFQDEQEIRATWSVDPWWRFVKYRPGRFGITPYIEVAASTRNQDDPRHVRGVGVGKIARLPIRSICIGPTRAAEETKRSLRAFLNAYGYGEVEILQSSTPYR